MDISFTLTPKQKIAWDLLVSEQGNYVLYGGAKGGGKSWMLCLWSFFWAKHLIELFGLKEAQKFPIAVGFLGRKRSVDFSKTTLETWKKIIPINSYSIKEQDKEIVIEGKVKILYGGLDDQEMINKFNSAELAFYALDQAEETERGDVSVLSASLRLTYNGIIPPFKRLYTANPSECWLKEDFISSPKQNHHYIPALYSDNPHLPENYVKTLEEAFSYDDVLLRAYRDGDWSALQADNVLITSEMLNALRAVPADEKIKKLAVISCDPSLGGDECIIEYNVNGDTRERKTCHTDNTMIVAQEVLEMAHRVECFDFVCDVIGIGAGVADRSEQQGMRVIRINSAAQAMNKIKFSNVRAEMWWLVKEKIDRHELMFPKDEETRKQLCAVHFKIQGGRVQLELKEITKRRLGRSPDRADAYVMAIYALYMLAQKQAWNTGKPEFASQSTKLEFANAGAGKPKEYDPFS